MGCLLSMKRSQSCRLQEPASCPGPRGVSLRGGVPALLVTVGLKRSWNQVALQLIIQANNRLKPRPPGLHRAEPASSGIKVRIVSPQPFLRALLGLRSRDGRE